MAQRYDHLREKAIQLRTERNMTLDDIVERLALPKTTVYYWIKDLPIPWTEKQSEAQRKRAQKNRDKYAALREAAYQQGLAEVPELLKDVTFRDFVVLYMAEGYKRSRNEVAFVNSDPAIVKLGYRWIAQFARNKLDYPLQYHADHDPEELKAFWADVLNIDANLIKPVRKSNSNRLSGRQFRSKYGLLTVRVGDTYLRARLEAWMDFIKNQW
jgi:AcrR family transcriptional regulator